ncbi:MAG: hypothetical protein TR69_WS6001001006 [candidate division WS6 bacterium OLB20]|uniref:Glycosyltransferase RgtA/B/C/D-like domain-containing protein n=1 Tax=candidate division WS6 bacterium OLB20 TaxID=1617426 RepID=A0A136LZB1_9BACT|nr:MAG: hypothetical protein TR69_WS6001001006 [candidate division WS6 bacterium OLB20]
MRRLFSQLTGNRHVFTTVTIVTALFFFINVFWITADQRLPFIGDDARFLQGTFELYEPLSRGDFVGAYNTWENMFIHPDRFPRTPLFAALSVPAFLIFGVSENTALMMNLLVLAVNGILIFLLARKLFFGLPARQANAIGLLALVLYSVMPGAYGFARLYMSETLQTFFVLLLTYLFVRYRSSSSRTLFFATGVLLSLAFLLRFLMPVYLVVPLTYFIYWQLRQKKSWHTYVEYFVITLIGFIPFTLTWYASNFATYLEFARFTSSGELAQYYSLGPVSSPVTAVRFWYVIVTWTIGWPLTVFMLLQVFAGAAAARSTVIRSVRHRFSSLNRFVDGLLGSNLALIILTPLPMLISLTLNESKTARYFVPVIAFWILAAAYVAVRTGSRSRIWMTGTLITAALCVYPFLQSVATFMPALPRTGLNEATGPYTRSEAFREPYSFVLSYYIPLEDEQPRVYNTAEQPLFNDAQLIWYASQQGVTISSSDEFSRYTDLVTGKAEVDEADFVIVTDSPEAGEIWADKYEQLREYVENNDRFFLAAQKEMSDGSVYSIYVRLEYLGN